MLTGFSEWSAVGGGLGACYGGHCDGVEEGLRGDEIE